MNKLVLFLVSLLVLSGVAVSVVMVTEAAGGKVRGENGQGDTNLNCVHEGLEDLGPGCVYEVSP